MHQCKPYHLLLVLALHAAARTAMCPCLCKPQSCWQSEWKGSSLDWPKPPCHMANINQVFKYGKTKLVFFTGKIDLLWTWMAVLTSWDHLFFAVREKIFWSKRLPNYISDQLKQSELFPRTNPALISKLPFSPSTPSLLFLHQQTFPVRARCFPGDCC